MAKTKTKFVCQNCGYTTAKWMGRCPECGTWDSLAEELETPASGPQQSFLMPKEAPKPKTLDKVMLTEVERLKTGINEFDRVLGGGIVKGSLVLLSGDPGIGKSTILLQICQNLGNIGQKILYVSGEESANQIKLRADRLGVTTDNLYILPQTDLGTIIECIKSEKPDIVYACGPMIMLKNITKICEENGIYCQVSLEQRMACGVGACLVCVCRTVKDGQEFNSHVCKDGPVFDSEEVVFDE